MKNTWGSFEQLAGSSLVTLLKWTYLQVLIQIFNFRYTIASVKEYFSMNATENSNGTAMLSGLPLFDQKQSGTGIPFPAKNLNFL